jgi:ABC-2 type transport system ATP-binding protein
MIEVERLTKKYGAHAAVRGVSFAVGKGQIVGFLGPNGAGKSTTMRILAGYLAASSGKVMLGGHDIESRPDAAKALLGYMPEAVPLYPEMRVHEYLRFRAELKGVARRSRALHVEEAMTRAQVTDVAHATIGHLSKGYRQRVGLADALVAKPPILILDEPTAGLDPNQIREVRDVLCGLGADYTILLSTHILSEVEATCSRAIVIDRGRVLAHGTLDEIRAKHAPRSLRMVCRCQPEFLRDALAEFKDARATVEDAAGDGLARATVTLAADGASAAAANAGPKLAALAEAVASALAAKGLPLRELMPVATSLEEVFTRLTRTGESSEARAASQTTQAGPYRSGDSASSDVGASATQSSTDDAP